MLCHDRLGVQPLHLVWNRAALLQGEQALDLLLQLVRHFPELPSKCRPGRKSATDGEGSPAFETSRLHAFAAGSAPRQWATSGKTGARMVCLHHNTPDSKVFGPLRSLLVPHPRQTPRRVQQPFFKFMIR